MTQSVNQIWGLVWLFNSNYVRGKSVSSTDRELTQIQSCSLLTIFLAPPRPNLSSGISSATLQSALLSVLNSSKSTCSCYIIKPSQKTIKFLLCLLLEVGYFKKFVSVFLTPNDTLKHFSLNLPLNHRTKYLLPDRVIFSV